MFRLALLGLLAAACIGCAATAEAHGGRGSVRFRSSFRQRGFVNHGFAAQRFVGVPVRSYHAQRFVAPIRSYSVQQFVVPQQVIVPQTYVVPQTFVAPVVVPQTYGSSLQFQFSTGY